VVVLSPRHHQENAADKIHEGFGGNLMVGVAEGFGGKLMRIVSFLGLRFESSSSSPKPVATVGPRGRLGGGLLACGFGFGFCSSGMGMYGSGKRSGQR